MSAASLDRVQLAECLRALAHENRLDLLDLLRVPHALPQVRLSPTRLLPGENPARAMSRQAVHEHVAKLLEVGLLLQRDAEGRRGREYVVNPQRLYQILEELRGVAAASPDHPAARDETVPLAEAPPVPRAPGPRLVLAHGLAPGQVFPLHRNALRDGRGWIIGRRAGLHVSLDHDPFVSLENCEIVPEPGGFTLVDLRHSRNGTHLNWSRLARGSRAHLKAGDIIGVGRSLLVLQTEP
ncbi:MAG: protease PrsW [Thermoplasmata archaeon]|jgi:DNA-binding transcriptional ArsR family regulator|nr:protease PrsW [Thermoplasmata archaeon]